VSTHLELVELGGLLTLTELVPMSTLSGTSSFMPRSTLPILLSHDPSPSHGDAVKASEG
jgi:hypothetical protein